MLHYTIILICRNEHSRLTVQLIPPIIRFAQELDVYLRAKCPCGVEVGDWLWIHFTVGCDGNVQVHPVLEIGATVL